MTCRRRHWGYAAWIGFNVLGPIAFAQVGDSAASGAATDSEMPRAGLTLQTTVEKIVRIAAADTEPKTELVPIATPLPGDEVVYTITFTNVSTTPAQNIRITNPIPPAMRYLAGTAVGPGSKVLYSVDGGRTYGMPAELLVADPDGGEARAAEAADYTHVRWVMDAPLDAGAKGFARFRAIVR